MDNSLAKKGFIEAYTRTFGNITQSCKAAGISSRQTYYNWLENDPEFAAELKAIEPDEIFMDFVENKMVQKINDGDTAVLIFVAKCKGKKRGYVEKSELDVTSKGEQIQGFNYVPPTNEVQ